jgi:PAS domain S-box-containing protein
MRDKQIEILIVEDSPTQAEILKLILENSDFKVHAAANGKGALEFLQGSSPEIVISDIVMPEMDGYELCRRMREDIRLREIPVILVTSLSDPTDVIKGLEVGANNFITKPYDENCLISHIQYLITNREMRKKSQSELGINVFFWGQNYHITAELPQILDLLLSIYENAYNQKRKLLAVQNELNGLNERLEEIVQDQTSELMEANKVLAIEVEVRKSAEEALRISEERFKLALRGANEGLWDWNVKLDMVYYAPRWKTMLGYADEELENHLDTWKRLVHPEDQEPSLARVRDFLERRAPSYEIEFRMRHKEGHYVDILSRGFPIYDDQGKALRMVGTHVDITERKKLEEQYLQAQKMEAVGQLAGGVAHDFNNILSAILGYSYLILDRENLDDTVKNHVEEIVAASNRAADLTRSLLAFSRKQPVSLAVIDLNQVIKDNEEFLRRLIREDIELKISCTGEPLTVLADRGQLEQVIMNLVANARDAMPHGGTLLIETLPAITLDREFLEIHGYGDSGTYNLISVSDNGEGMDKEMQLHIFEPFFTTKEQGKGTGLGLAMAYGIVKKHNGFINVYSEPGTGTTFKIYLPCVQATAPVEEMEQVKQAPLRGGTETILVGEDDAALRRLSTRVLSHYGYRVIEAVDGQDAVDKFIEYGESIHLVILDAIMPKKNGRDACQEMRMVRPELKAVFVSGYARDIFADGDVLDGNSIFIQKPVPPNDLVSKVRALLDKK